MRKRRSDAVLVGPRGVVGDRISWAVTFRTRRRGVLGRPPLQRGEVMALHPCRRVHTIGVPYPLDVVFCDEGLRVLHVQTLEPGSISARVRGARWCFELPGGTANACDLAPGVRLSFGEAS